MAKHHHAEMGHGESTMHPYRKLLIMTLLSFAAMYILMYSMVDQLSNVIHNINQVYMACLMATPMVIIELALMGAMYTSRKRNIVIIIACLAAMGSFFALIRTQGAVSDKEFLKSMIPHHASAILMSGQASLSEPEVRELAREIIASQQQEIRQMKAMLKAMEAN